MPVLNTQRPQIAPLTTSNLTRANLATLNEQQQKGSHIHSTHAHESVADASYYSNALSNYGSHSNAQSFTGSNNQHFNQPPISNVPQPPPPQFYPPIGQPQNFPGQTAAPNFHGTNSSSQWNNPQHQQYYR
ncbi:CBLL1.2 family protein [Megaselia abdita]